MHTAMIFIFWIIIWDYNSFSGIMRNSFRVENRDLLAHILFPSFINLEKPFLTKSNGRKLDLFYWGSMGFIVS